MKHLCRKSVLEKLQALTKALIYDISLEKGLPPEEARKAGGKVMTFGSCRLGVQAASKSYIESNFLLKKHSSLLLEMRTLMLYVFVRDMSRGRTSLMGYIRCWRNNPM